MRKKNALTEYEVAELTDVTATEPTGVSWKNLGHRILEVSDESEDETDDYSDYAGDGSISQDITAYKEEFEFEGQREYGDEAQDFIVGLKYNLDGRGIWLRVTMPDGTVHTSKAVVSNIIDKGGEASEWQPFQCTITRSEMPIEVKEAFVEEPTTEEPTAEEPTLPQA